MSFFHPSFISSILCFVVVSVELTSLKQHYQRKHFKTKPLAPVDMFADIFSYDKLVAAARGWVELKLISLCVTHVLTSQVILLAAWAKHWHQKMLVALGTISTFLGFSAYVWLYYNISVVGICNKTLFVGQGLITSAYTLYKVVAKHDLAMWMILIGLTVWIVRRWRFTNVLLSLWKTIKKKFQYVPRHVYLFAIYTLD